MPGGASAQEPEEVCAQKGGVALQERAAEEQVPVPLEERRTEVCAVSPVDSPLEQDQTASPPAKKKRGRPPKTRTTPLKRPENASTLPADFQPERPRALSKADLIQGIASKRFRKIAFMVGAGISVAAGIPDFRSPKSGLYAQVKEMGLPCPEDIFSLDYLQDDPRPFFSLAKRLLQDADPVCAHRFMKAVADRKQLLMVYTQNIDGLELQAGIPANKVMQAHGHMRSAHCIKCRHLYTIEDFMSHAHRDEVMLCGRCRSIVKPDIIFFGESVPRKFDSLLTKIVDADLVLVMGTSLQVRPFSGLLQHISAQVPIAIINRDLPKAAQASAQREQILFLQGDIEEVVLELTQEMGWVLPPAASALPPAQPKPSSGQAEASPLAQSPEAGKW